MGKDEFVFDWIKRIGYRKNPFDPENHYPKAFSGYSKQRQKINLFILERYQFGTVSGEKGSGKTALLKWVEEKLSRHKDKVRVAYVNAADLGKERDLIVALTEPLVNIYERTVKKIHLNLKLEELGKFLHSKLKNRRQMIILLDDVGKLPKRYVPLFKYFFTQRIGVQVIAAGTKDELNASGIREIWNEDQLKIYLEGLSYEEMKSLLESRISRHGRPGVFPFEEGMLKDAFKRSEGNPETFLGIIKEKAVKLSLDGEYMKKKLRELEEQVEQEASSEKKVISIKLGQSREEDSSEDTSKDDFEPIKAPDASEQEEMLAEIVSQTHEEKPGKITYDGKEQEEIPIEMETIKVPSPDEEAEESKEEEPEKLSRREKRRLKKEAKETENLLADLAKEFEEK